MKKKILFVFTSLLLFSLAAFALAPPTQSVEIRMEYDSQGNLMVFADNKDFCDYYLSVILSDIRGSDMQTHPYNATISRGERKLFTIKKVSDFTYPTGRVSYMAYRGNVNPKLKTDFIYSLPVKPGDTVQAGTAKNSGDFTLAFDLSRAGDTIYACREGRICDYKLTDQTAKGHIADDKIIVYHNDGSLSEYAQFEKSLVFPGEFVKIGQPIAINTGKTVPKTIIFAVYYLDKNKVKNAETGSKHSHLIPVFHTLNAGDVKLEEDATYTGEITEDMIIQEMSDREKKKYEKKKANK